MIVDVVMVMMARIVMMFDISSVLLATWPGGYGAFQPFSQAITRGYGFQGGHRIPNTSVQDSFTLESVTFVIHLLAGVV